jgi:hypothetical protein
MAAAEREFQKQEPATVTADQTNGYDGRGVFDLGQEVASFFVRIEITAIDGDGETWGEDYAQTPPMIAVFPSLLIADTDLLNWVNIAPTNYFAHSPGGGAGYTGGSVFPITVGDYQTLYGLAPRFLAARLWIPQLNASSAGNYTGANFPYVTASVAANWV